VEVDAVQKKVWSRYLLAPKGSDEPLVERMRARHKGDRFDFLDVENSQIRSPPMKSAIAGHDRN
jgi:hypothetical protein